MKRLLYWSILCLCLVLIPKEALANGLANHPMLNKPGGLYPIENVPFIVDKELLTIDLNQMPVTVNAQYHLRNPLTDKATVQVLFPIGKNYTTSVQFGDQPVKAELATNFDAMNSEDLQVSKYWIDPFTGRNYLPQNAGSDLQFDLLQFSISLNPLESETLSVTYKQAPSYDPTRFFRNPVERFDYLLLPAKHWGSYKNLQINLIASNSIQFNSNLHFVKNSSDSFIFKSENLPPENLSVFFLPHSSISGTFASFYYRYFLQIWIAVLIVLLGAVIIRQRIKHNRHNFDSN